MVSVAGCLLCTCASAAFALLRPRSSAKQDEETEGGMEGKEGEEEMETKKQPGGAGKCSPTQDSKLTKPYANKESWLAIGKTMVPEARPDRPNQIESDLKLINDFIASEVFEDEEMPEAYSSLTPEEVAVVIQSKDEYLDPPILSPPRSHGRSNSYSTMYSDEEDYRLHAPGSPGRGGPLNSRHSTPPKLRMVDMEPAILDHYHRSGIMAEMDCAFSDGDLPDDDDIERSTMAH